MIQKPIKLDKRKSRIVARLVAESRHFVRGKLVLKGTFLAENGWEYPFETLDISPGGMHISAEYAPAAGQSVSLTLEQLGRIQTKVIRQTGAGFAISVISTSRKRSRLADQLTWILNAERLGLEDDRAGPRDSKHGKVHISLADGTRFTGTAINVSITGMAIESQEQVNVGEHIQIGTLKGTIARKLDTGFAVQFEPPDVDKKKS